MSLYTLVTNSGGSVSGAEGGAVAQNQCLYLTVYSLLYGIPVDESDETTLNNAIAEGIACVDKGFENASQDDQTACLLTLKIEISELLLSNKTRDEDQQVLSEALLVNEGITAANPDDLISQFTQLHHALARTEAKKSINLLHLAINNMDRSILSVDLTQDSDPIAVYLEFAQIVKDEEQLPRTIFFNGGHFSCALPRQDAEIIDDYLYADNDFIETSLSTLFIDFMQTACQGTSFSHPLVLEGKATGPYNESLFKYDLLRHIENSGEPASALAALKTIDDRELNGWLEAVEPDLQAANYQLTKTARQKLAQLDQTAVKVKLFQIYARANADTLRSIFSVPFFENADAAVEPIVRNISESEQLPFNKESALDAIQTAVQKAENSLEKVFPNLFRNLSADTPEYQWLSGLKEEIETALKQETQVAVFKIIQQEERDLLPEQQLQAPTPQPNAADFLQVVFSAGSIAYALTVLSYIQQGLCTMLEHVQGLFQSHDDGVKGLSQHTPS